MRQLDYQARVLDTLDAYLTELTKQKIEADKVEDLKRQNPGLPIPSVDFAEAAWSTLREAGKLPASRADVPFSPRHDGCGRVVPNVTLKVPTGGGKTYLATNGVSKVLSKYLSCNAGFVLWIVPNEAIYTQTLKNLKDREHPYRQVLDRASAFRTKIMEKGDRLHAVDVETHLCVMVLMLQSGNRENKETLRMFRDRGDVHGFFPPEGEQQAHEAMLKAVPNLDYYDHFGRIVKDSLGNALRSIRPVVVMDEGQKATSQLAYDTLYGFNPSFVLELTATPKDVRAADGKPARFANLLVEVMGRELHQEEMIKMPLNLDPRQGTDWRTTLTAGLDKLNELDATARAFTAEKGSLRYIRPIMLVQVERTGKEQRDGAHIHSEDVKEWLLTAGLDEAEVAIKTAEKNDLNQPENLDLLSDKNRVRVIITKSALQEGWDCPFAYVLCSLSASSNMSAMTQLVGRILRQPHALKTGVDALDECYVITHHADTAAVVASIKKGLEADGLGDMVLAVSGDAGATQRVQRTVNRRPAFETLDIFLPKVLWLGDGEPREFDYETDLLARIDWRGYDPTPTAERVPENPTAATSQLQRISLAESGDELLENVPVSAKTEAVSFDPAYVSRVVSDLVPNPFVARAIVADLIKALEARGFSKEKIGTATGTIISLLREDLERERLSRSEAQFKTDIADGLIQFRLRIDGKNWRMPSTITTTEPDGADTLTNKHGLPLEKNLFAPVYKAELNADERRVAVMLDDASNLKWWHRNAVGSYGLPGWRRGRIYPDFLFAVKRSGENGEFVALETKGDHLQNEDTDYKRALLEALTEGFAWDNTTPVGELELTNSGETVRCELILMKDIKADLPKVL
ncbi:MAG: DEAD/DEAH box helicase family protein [Pseudomonadota bacterium]|nr:DEAD/DEAH box helicase family protein [Pseudomonadota bacterium]